MTSKMNVTAMFEELAKLGHITPAQELKDMTFPGSYAYVPTVTTYGTPEIPAGMGVNTDAKLGQRAERDQSKSD